MNHITRLALATLLITALAPLPNARGSTLDFSGTPGSLLIYPEFDNRPGVITLISITNIEGSPGQDVDVEFVYVRSLDMKNEQIHCEEFNRTHTLTPKDNFTALTWLHGPPNEQGYIYAFAKDPDSGMPIVHNHLIGDVRILNGINQRAYSLNPFAYDGINSGDINGNRLRDLDGEEYEVSPGMIHIPRFLGIEPELGADLILINLTGGVEFVSTADFLVYNDNEEVFSAEYTFYCWDRRPLEDISTLFTQLFLEATFHDPSEVYGASAIEAGWFELFGIVAQSSTTQILDPAILAVLVEHWRGGANAHLPFMTGTNPNGKLLPTDLNGEFGWQ